MDGQTALEPLSALLRFYSKEDVSRYMKGLIENYQKQIELHADRLGSILRLDPKAPNPEKKRDKSEKVAEGKTKVTAKGWIKMGSMLFNTADPVNGNSEVIFQLHEEMKQKLARTAESLKSFEDASASIIPEGAIYLLYVRNGVPERLIVDSLEKKSAAFNFQAKFKIV